MLIFPHRQLKCLFIATLCSLTLHAQPQYYVSDILISGNKITKEKIILRELYLQRGDSIQVSRLAYELTCSKENLDNLSLFNFVDVGYFVIPDTDDQIVIEVHVEERWYYIPLVSIVPADRNTSSWIKNFDLARITFEAGAQLYNMWGLNHTITPSIRFGYYQALHFHYRNITLDRAQKHFLSTGITLQRSHNADVMTIDDAPLQLKIPEQMLYESAYGYIAYTYRHDARRTHNVSVGYEYKKIADTLLLINPDYWGNQRSARTNLSLQYFFKVEQRDFIPFPLKGYYLKMEGNFYVSTDLSVRYFQAKGNAQYYLPLGGRWFVSERLTAGVSMKNTKAYILDQALGYDEHVLRGYEYHVIDGQHYAALNSTLRFNIIPTKIFVIEWLSALSKFNKIHYALYAHTFIDMGAALHRYPNRENHLSNQFLYSSGIGLDFVTYYDIVLSLSYSINRQREKGLYFSFKLPLE